MDWATIRAVRFTREIGLFDIILEGDTMQIVTAIFTDLSNWSKFGHFIEGIKEEVTSLRSFRVIHTRKEANTAAHILLKTASAHVRDSISLEEVPHFLSGIVCRKLAVPTF
jgi:hypothetical protein